METEAEEGGPAAARDSLRIGAASNDGSPVGLPLSALPTHVAVVGAAGSGKTWMAKVVAEEAIRLGVPVHGGRPAGRPRPVPPPVGRAARPLRPRNARLRREFLDRVEPRIWTPGSSHGRRLSLDPIHLPGRDELARIANPDRREEEWQEMLGGAAAQLVGLAKLGGETDSQQTFLLQVFRRLARQRARSRREPGGHRRRGLRSRVDRPGRAGPAHQEVGAHRSWRASSTRCDSARPSTLFTGGTRLDLDAMCRPDEAGKTPLNVIYLNALVDDDLKHFFTAALAAEIYRWMITSLDAMTGRPSMLFYLDEARDYIPAGTAKPPAKGPLIRLFTQGRKYGVACLLCTQSPRSVDYNVFGNCSTKLVGRLESQQDLERVAQWFTTEGPTPPWIAGARAPGRQLRRPMAADARCARGPALP